MGNLGEVSFKLKDSGSGVQSGKVHGTATNRGISQDNQSSDESSLAASQEIT